MASAVAILTCSCGRSITLPLRPGPGNDPALEIPPDWRMWFVDDDVTAECPDCRLTITERGKAVVESGMTVRQAHEIETGCSPDALCADCTRLT